MKFHRLFKKNKSEAEKYFVSETNKELKKRQNIILKLWEGEYSITITFWIFLVSLPLTANLIFSFIFIPILDLTVLKGKIAFFLSVFCIALFIILAACGLWHSQNNGFEKKSMKNFAKVASVLGIIFAVFYIFYWYIIFQLIMLE